MVTRRRACSWSSERMKMAPKTTTAGQSAGGVHASRKRVKGLEPSTFTLARLERTVANFEVLAVYDAPDSTLHRRLHKATRKAPGPTDHGLARGPRRWRHGGPGGRRRSAGPIPSGRHTAKRRQSLRWTIPVAWRFNLPAQSAVEALPPANQDRHPRDTKDAPVVSIVPAPAGLQSTRQ